MNREFWLESTCGCKLLIKGRGKGDWSSCVLCRVFLWEDSETGVQISVKSLPKPSGSCCGFHIPYRTPEQLWRDCKAGPWRRERQSPALTYCQRDCFNKSKLCPDMTPPTKLWRSEEGSPDVALQPPESWAPNLPLSVTYPVHAVGLQQQETNEDSS